MGLRKLSILIPSYKRPNVLERTLNGLLDNTASDENFEINVGIGFNKYSSIEVGISNWYNTLFKSKNIKYSSLFYDHNVGKAVVLNELFKKYANDSDLVITMDNDMLIKMPWTHYVTLSDLIDYDIMGFSSSRFWAHDPIMEKCPSTESNGRKFFSPYSVAGGIMLFHRDFLANNPWTNHGGVYGRDDASMCLLTQKKYVLHSDENWLDHDPLSSSTADLKLYEDKKKALYKSGVTVFPEGWDE